MTKQKLTLAEVTDEVIKGWKEQYGKITKWKTADGKVVFFRSPDRSEIAAAQTVARDENGVASNQVLAKATALGGDVEILTQDKYLIGLGKHLQKIIETVEGELEEL